MLERDESVKMEMPKSGKKNEHGPWMIVRKTNRRGTQGVEGRISNDKSNYETKAYG